MRRTWRKPLLALVAVAATAAAAWLGLGPSQPRPLTGHATVVDGDTLRLGARRIRLDGLDAPESAQTCERDGAPWPCGAEATRALRERLRGRELRCADHGRDRYDRVLGQCWAGDDDIGAWMVREGWAVAYTRYSWRYVPQELRARWEGRGLWSGRFETPEEWRRRQGR